MKNLLSNAQSNAKTKKALDEFGYEAVIQYMEHDFRFRDPKGYIVGLIARGRAKKDTTGFVVD